MRRSGGSKPKIVGGGRTVSRQELFFTEFHDVLKQLSSTPGIGERYRRARVRLIQRVLMKKTRCHVYYFCDHERDLIEIHSIWGARRKREPTL